jgi:hypothetical protein
MWWHDMGVIVGSGDLLVIVLPPESMVDLLSSLVKVG